ncbi:MAG TPA: hypothetical protein P5080_01335 [Candidatus Paceibacterota bacterium]|nr:hypothetical protein [Candidatus Pacearchaeota archaeon]HRZ50767.1 hypothetical protein [Candidatus Paceibacterota bacterium]HSA36336.1 hypothetical protein [Candidatus Paceibacterota bacterium]
MLAVLTLALVAFAILLATAMNTNDAGDVPGRSFTELYRIFASPLLVMLAIAAVCLALGPGPPASIAGSSGVSCTSVSSDNGASSNYARDH